MNGETPHLASRLTGAQVLPPMEEQLPGPAASRRGESQNTPRRPGKVEENGRDRVPASGRADRRRTAGRFQLLNAFVDAGMKDLTRVEVMTWFALYRDARDGIAQTSAESIAVRCGCSKRAVIQAIGRLRQRGFLVQLFKGGINRGPSRYRVEAPPAPTKRLVKLASP